MDDVKATRLKMEAHSIWQKLLLKLSAFLNFGLAVAVVLA